MGGGGGMTLSNSQIFAYMIGKLQPMKTFD